MTDSSVEAVARARENIEYALDMATEDEVFAGSVCDIDSRELRLLLALPSPEREPLREAWQPLRDLVDAARGLSHGVDWNNGTNAKLHGYRRKLLDALPGAEAALAALAPPPAQSGDRT